MTYEQTRKFAPKLALKAMGISRVTEEIIGLMVARSLSLMRPAGSFEGSFGFCATLLTWMNIVIGLVALLKCAQIFVILNLSYMKTN
jgi:hypothetical protein